MALVYWFHDLEQLKRCAYSVVKDISVHGREYLGFKVLDDGTLESTLNDDEATLNLYTCGSIEYN